MKNFPVLSFIFKSPKSWFAALLLGGALSIAYSNSFHCPFIFDDSGSIHENETIHSLLTGFLPGGNSGNTVSGRPVLNFTLAINYAISGEHVVSYHLGNLLIHFCGALALFGFVRRTLLLPSLRDQFGLHSWWSALAIAALWALHPLQTESVTYIVQRAESLVGMFYLLTLYCFVRAVELNTATSTGEGKTAIIPQTWLCLSSLACFLGMGSKEVMAGAPIIVFLYDRTFVSNSFREAWRIRKRYYVWLAATWLLLAACILWTGKRGSTVGYNEFATWWRYAMTQGFAIMHYLKLAFWPHPLVLDYGTTMAADFKDAGLQTIIVSIMALGTLWSVFKYPKQAFFAACFFSILAPSSSFVPVLTQTMAEHRMYLALAPIAAMVVLTSQRLLGARALAVILLIAIIFIGLTFRRNYDYRSEESIWTSVAEKCPYNSRGWGALAAIYLKQENFTKSKWATRQGLLYSPDNTDILTDYGNVLCKLKEYREAEQVYRYTLKLQPNHYRAICGLGVLLLDMEMPEDAKKLFEKALVENPNATEARYSLGKSLVALNRLPEAILEFKALVKNDPRAVDARNNLGNAMINMGNAGEAIPLLKEGIKFDPKSTDLQRTLGLALLSTGQTDDAIRQFQNILRDTPNDAKAHANLALAFANTNQPVKALEQFEAAIQFGRDEIPKVTIAIHISAAEAAIKASQISKAREHYESAVQLDPANPQVRYLLANLLMQIGENREAASNYEKIISTAPGMIEAHSELATVYDRLGRKSEARIQFETASRLAAESKP